jgi:hypothetical protein
MQGDEMKLCPHCQTVMEEKPGSDGDLKLPQLPADDQPPALKVTRVRWECPKCPHIEESRRRECGVGLCSFLGDGEASPPR